MVTTLTEPERRLLEMLAAEGKATRLMDEDLLIAKALEEAGLVFVIRNTLDAIITPKGRHLLAGEEKKSKPAKPPLGFLE
jgi:hypothetical protein